MPQPLLVDSGAAQTVSHTEDVVSEPQDSGIRRVQGRCLLHESRWQHRGPRRRENVDHVNSRWSTIEERDVPSGKRQQWFWVSLEDGVEWSQSGVRHIRVIPRQQLDERRTVAPGKRWRVCCGHDGGAARKRTEGQTAFWEVRHAAGLVSPSEPTEKHGVWDRGGLHAMDDAEKMDEDKEKD